MAWVYPRPQGWFEEIYENPVMFSLWKNDFSVSKETFDLSTGRAIPFKAKHAF